jgi:hypothetical protein
MKKYTSQLVAIVVTAVVGILVLTVPALEPYREALIQAISLIALALLGGIGLRKGLMARQGLVGPTAVPDYTAEIIIVVVTAVINGLVLFLPDLEPYREALIQAIAYIALALLGGISVQKAMSGK